MAPPTIPFTLDLPTALSLGAVFSLVPVSLLLSKALIPASHRQNRLLFVWHAFDAFTHFLVEGSFLYNCFFSYQDLNDLLDKSNPLTTRTNHAHRPPFFLSRADRLYGAAYGTGPTARLWQEYGKADSRWAGADTNVISIELLTVFMDGPLAVYICYLLYKASSAQTTQQSQVTAAANTGKLWFCSVFLAVAELYGGFMTFAPEWLSGNTALATEDPVYLWLYLSFFNILWVIIPFGVLFVAWNEIKTAFVKNALSGASKKSN
ncbi:hypothetical protein FQN57_002118 [Myotisia sp. PD_48]|nr:hypothetical protein FQN57_002118 [Myotisia sp. PD_48]